MDNIWWEHFLDTCHGSGSNQSGATTLSTVHTDTRISRHNGIIFCVNYVFVSVTRILKATMPPTFNWIKKCDIHNRVQIKVLALSMMAMVTWSVSWSAEGLSLWLVSHLSSHKVGAQSSGLSSLISQGRTPLLDRVKRGNLVMKIMFQMNQSPCQAIGIWRVNHNT